MAYFSCLVSVKLVLFLYPDFYHLMQEYHDGMLLFEISNREVWSKPAAEQSRLEIEWIKRLETKYPVIINWKLLKKIKK